MSTTSIPTKNEGDSNAVMQVDSGNGAAGAQGPTNQSNNAVNANANASEMNQRQQQQQMPQAQAQSMMEDSMAGGVSMEDDQNYQFYKEYCRLYYANIILTNRLQQLLNEKKDLQFKLSRLESNRQAHEEALGMTFDITDERRKRHRRTANEIQRHYVCPVEDCPKSYGSEGSLNQHLKIKHLEYYQAQLQAANAQQNLVPAVISQAQAGKKMVGLSLPSQDRSSNTKGGGGADGGDTEKSQSNRGTSVVEDDDQLMNTNKASVMKKQSEGSEDLSDDD